jgi:glycosyltransferase involved in cell wall biosynthesis
VRVVLLTHYFPPEVGAPQTRLGELATGLARRGFEVTVHTAPPHYPDGVVRAPYRNRLLSVQRTPDGVRVLRSAVYATPNRGFTRRLLNHASHAASALATAPAAGACDVVVAEAPPLFTAAAGVLYARAKRARLILHAADLWPESAVELGMLRHRGAISAATSLAHWCYSGADAVVVPTDGMHDRLSAMEGLAHKVVAVSPAVDVDRFTPGVAGSVGPLRVAYAGTLGLAQGVGTLIEAAALAGPDAVRVTIAGGGAELEQVRALIDHLEATNVRLAGLVAPQEVPRMYAGHDAGVVLLRDRPLFEAALPTKLFEILAARRPAVVAARGDAADLVRRAGAGVAVSPEDPRALAEAFRMLSADPAARARMGAAGRDYVAKHHARRAMVDRWAALIETHGLRSAQQ